MSTSTPAGTPQRSLEGKVVVVTGGNSGIGEGIVRAAAAQGAKVVIDYVSRPGDTEAIIADIRAGGGEAVGCEADVSSVADLQRLVDTAVEAFGRLDVMVNNAGVEFEETLATLTEERYDLLMGINLKGAPATDRLLASTGMCTHKVSLTSIDDIDGELVGWLQAAYNAA